MAFLDSWLYLPLDPFEHVSIYQTYIYAIYRAYRTLFLLNFRAITTPIPSILKE